MITEEQPEIPKYKIVPPQLKDINLEQIKWITLNPKLPHLTKAFHLEEISAIEEQIDRLLGEKDKLQEIRKENNRKAGIRPGRKPGCQYPRNQEHKQLNQTGNISDQSRLDNQGIGSNYLNININNNNSSTSNNTNINNNISKQFSLIESMNMVSFDENRNINQIQNKQMSDFNIPQSLLMNSMTNISSKQQPLINNPPIFPSGDLLGSKIPFNQILKNFQSTPFQKMLLQSDHQNGLFSQQQQQQQFPFAPSSVNNQININSNLSTSIFGNTLKNFTDLKNLENLTPPQRSEFPSFNLSGPISYQKVQSCDIEPQKTPQWTLFSGDYLRKQQQKGTQEQVVINSDVPIVAIPYIFQYQFRQKCEQQNFEFSLIAPLIESIGGGIGEEQQDEEGQIIGQKQGEGETIKEENNQTQIEQKQKSQRKIKLPKSKEDSTINEKKKKNPSESDKKHSEKEPKDIQVTDEGQNLDSVKRKRKYNKQKDSNQTINNEEEQSPNGEAGKLKLEEQIEGTKDQNGKKEQINDEDDNDNADVEKQIGEKSKSQKKQKNAQNVDAGEGKEQNNNDNDDDIESKEGDENDDKKSVSENSSPKVLKIKQIKQISEKDGKENKEDNGESDDEEEEEQKQSQDINSTNPPTQKQQQQIPPSESSSDDESDDQEQYVLYGSQKEKKKGKRKKYNVENKECPCCKMVIKRHVCVHILCQQPCQRQIKEEKLRSNYKEQRDEVKGTKSESVDEAPQEKIDRRKKIYKHLSQDSQKSQDYRLETETQEQRQGKNGLDEEEKKAKIDTEEENQARKESEVNSGGDNLLQKSQDG